MMSTISRAFPPLFAALLGFGPTPSRPPEEWRLRYLRIHLEVDPAARRIDGLVELTVEAPSRPAPLRVDMSDSLTLDSARVVDAGMMAETGIRERDRLRFPLERAKPGKRYQVAVWYHGSPARRAVGMAGTSPGYRVASYGLPLSAREWWPALDDPSQKADSAELWITAPSALTVVSNGRLLSRSASATGSTATTHWSVHHPVYPDALSFAIGDYVTSERRISIGSDRQVLLQTFAFPEDSARAAAVFAPAADILRFYSERLGGYPFADEKYALVEFARPSFREGQTVSHIGAAIVKAGQGSEQVIAHEIAHQWFGNSLTVRSWAEIWLNESLAEYMAWQWIRQSRGDTAFQALIDSATVAPVTAPLVPADPSNFATMFGNATFQRGPVVLIMLEHEIGTRAFGVALRRYVEGHRAGTVETADFQRACEKASGKSLAAFFARWVRGDAALGKVDGT